MKLVREIFYNLFKWSYGRASASAQLLLFKLKEPDCNYLYCHWQLSMIGIWKKQYSVTTESAAGSQHYSKCLKEITIKSFFGCVNEYTNMFSQITFTRSQG